VYPGVSCGASSPAAIGVFSESTVASCLCSSVDRRSDTRCGLSCECARVADGSCAGVSIDASQRRRVFGLLTRGSWARPGRFAELRASGVEWGVIVVVNAERVEDGAHGAKERRLEVPSSKRRHFGLESWDACLYPFRA
jgi:hypothetical protein